ncbi:MAG TPA: cytochrome C [Candidatus Polarisedimenticolia bacterium]|nr:cytochrome C [Candidatus Polarisedimenticolia bacterium]
MTRRLTDSSAFWKTLAAGAALAGVAWLGAAAGDPPPAEKKPADPKAADPASADDYLKQTPAATADRPADDYGLGPNAGSKLPPYPPGAEGDPTPLDLYKYAGRGASSWGSPNLKMSFADWLAAMQKQKPALMAKVTAYMNSRYDWTPRPRPGAKMSGGKAIMDGPVARLPKGVASFEDLARLGPDTIRDRDLFPYKPLAHPLQTTAHMLFTQTWVKAHPEHERIDVDFDIPDAFLPEFPPPMFLTTHKELGDVTKGHEVTLGNYYAMFNGLLTGEQMEGLKELLRVTPTTWFNHTEHRVTAAPSAGVSCFSCHVNGHTNASIELAPDSRPNQARLRMDTPSMRGNFNFMQLSSKRSIRSMDHFAEVEEYFDGDPGLMQAIGPRAAQRQVTNRMGDFNSILDFPPAPKLSPLMTLVRSKATPAELRGEAIFHGKGQCASCHSGPAFTDDYLHDLQVERFYVGRPEGPIKTFGLRGIKDSPPYLHDGRAPTLADAVEFFDLVLELGLTKDEKADLVAFLLCL